MKLGIWYAEHFLFICWSVTLSNGSFDWSTQGMGSDHTPRSGLPDHTEHSESFPNYSEESLGVPRQINTGYNGTILSQIYSATSPATILLSI